MPATAIRYTTTQTATMLGITPGRVRQLAHGRGVGARTIDGWMFSTADIEALRERAPGRPRADIEPRDYLTLSPQEATLIVAALNDHLRTPGIGERDELMLTVLDSVGPDAEGDRLDEMYGVSDWKGLVVRVSALSHEQAAMVMDAAEAYWGLDPHADNIEDDLHAVGLI